MSSQQHPLPAKAPQAVTGTKPDKRPRGGRARFSAMPQVPDQLAVRRQRKVDELAAVARYIEARLDALEYAEAYTVPMLYVAVTGSLAPAHLLKLVEQWSEEALAKTESGWVRRSVQDWVNMSGLAEPDWVSARKALRAAGLIEERRAYDLVADEIVTEIRFMPDAFARGVAWVRDVIREDARTLLRDGHSL